MVTIRKASPEDAETLLEIYRPYVENTAVSFEYDTPSVEEFKNRIIDISSKYPYLVANNDDGLIVGYAYANTFKGRRAYDMSVETTIYLRRQYQRYGVGTLLYNTLEKSLSGMGILNMNACIAVPDKEMKYVTESSIRFHEKLGFKPVGIFHNSGYKFNHWFDMIWMEKMIGEHTSNNKNVKFGEWNI